MDACPTKAKNHFALNISMQGVYNAMPNAALPLDGEFGTKKKQCDGIQLLIV